MHKSKSKCHRIEVPKDVCYIRFGKDKIHHTVHEDYGTIRNEDVIMDFSKDGKLIGIELLGDGKPCQTLPITLKDLEIRYKGIRKKSPDVPNCSYPKCPNPIDCVETMGWDTSCAYHRLLFDEWLYNVIDGDIPTLRNKKIRRKRFGEWVKKIGKKKADKIVLSMANDGINWVT